jgi:[ribosomal protein S5]-alanine N-acetyltransferase
VQLPHLIETPRLVLRPPALTDAPAIYATYAHDPLVTRYMIWRPHRSLADTEEFLRGHLARKQTGTEGCSWVLTHKEDGRLIGMIALHPGAYRVGLGYVSGRAYWGRGLMPEAARALVDLALAQPDIFRVWAVCDVENIASARVMEKAGMTREGILRRWSLHPNVSDEPRDCLCYAKVR